MIKKISLSDSLQRIARNENWLSIKTSTSTTFEKLPIEMFFKNNLLAAQNEEVLNDLLPFLESVSLSRAEFLYHPGDPVEYLYFPETAVVSEFQILEDGRTVETAMIGNEGISGIMPLFGSSPATNWIQVLIGGKAARIEHRIFERIFFRHPSFQKSLLKFVNSYVQQISRRSVCNNYHLIGQRFCSWLLMLEYRRKHDRLALTQEQIARALGVHRPSVTHIAQNLRTKKIIDYVRGGIYILNRRELEESACRCFVEIDKHPEYLC